MVETFESVLNYAQVFLAAFPLVTAAIIISLVGLVFNVIIHAIRPK